MAVVTAPAGLPLWSDPLRFVWVNRVLVLALSGLGLVVGTAWAVLQPVTYAATSSVVLTPVPKYILPTGEGLVAPEVSIDTDAQLLYSPIVLNAVAEALGNDDGTAMDHLAVSATANSHVLHITATAGSPERAAAAANAAVKGLVQVRRDTLGSLRLDQMRLLRLWTTDQEDVLAKAAGVGVVVPSYDEMFGQVLELRTSLDELEEARKTPAQVVDPAVPPRRAVRSNAEVPITSGVMLGALLGILAGVLRERSDRVSALLAAVRRLRPSRRTFRPTALTTTG